MRQLLRRLWRALRQRQFDAELREELEFHRASIERELRERGAGATDAHFAARRAIGSVALAQDQARDVWTPRWLQGTGQDIRLAFRSLRATPIVTAVAVLSLALGLGANTAIFSLVDSVLLRPVSVRNPKELALVADPSAADIGAYTWSYPMWEQIRDRPQLFDGALAYFSTRFNLAATGQTDFVVGLWASGKFFDVLGISPILGRAFTEVDDQPSADPDGAVTLISYEFWQRRFAGAQDVLGHILNVGRVPFRIVGVLPPTFSGLVVGRTADIVIPFGADPLIHSDQSWLPDKGRGWVTIVVRLKAGQTREAATTALRGVQAEIRAATFPSSLTPSAAVNYLKPPLTLVSANGGNPFAPMRRRYEGVLGILLGGVTLVLLIACANIANLILARNAASRYDMSVRSALGASPWRLARLAIAESLVLASFGAAIGVAVAHWGGQFLVHLLSAQSQIYPLFVDLSIDTRVLTFAIVVSTLCAALCGAVPAFRSSQAEPVGALKAAARSGEGGGLGLLNGLVAAQVAVSLVLVVGAGLFGRTLTTLVTSDLGFDPNGVVIVSIDATTVPAAARFDVFDQVRRSSAQLPETAGAALADITPVEGSRAAMRVTVKNTGTVVGSQREVAVNSISATWLSVYKTPVVAGRDFTEADGSSGRPVAIVNRAFTQTFLNGGSPVGLMVRAEDRPGLPAREWQIVGLAADAVYQSVREPAPPTVYLPYGPGDAKRTGPAFTNLSVRSIGPPSFTWTTRLTNAVTAVNPNLVVSVRPLPEFVVTALTQERVLAILAGFYGGLALLLAGLGLYGITSYGVARRRREIGIRVALGAAPVGVIRLVLSRVFLLVSLGIAVGTLASLWAARFVASLLYGLQPHDPATLIGAVLVLATVAALAGWIPAWRASRIDPAVVLRNE